MAEAAFNLSAEISLQLAKGAAASLRNQIQKGFQAPLELTGTDKAVKQARKDAASKPIAVPITFKVANRTANVAAINRAIGKIPVDVQFVGKQVRESLTKANLLKILGTRKFYVEVEARFDKAAVKRLNSLQKTIDKLEKKALDLKGAINSVDDVKVNAAPLTNLSKQAEAASEDISNLILRLHDLANIKPQQFGGGKFFKQAEGQIYSLLQAMEKIGGSDALLLLEKKFEGLNGKSADNLINSLRTVFKAFTELEAQEKRINSAVSNGSKRNFSAELQGIQTAREAISKFLLELDSADPQTFSTLVSSTMKEVSDATRKSLISSSRDIERFSTLLSTLNQKKVAATGSGRAQTINNIDALIKRAEELNAKGFTVEAIKADSTYQTLAALVGELKYVDIAARRAQTSIENLLYKTKTGELGKTIGGRAIGLNSKVAAIGAATNAKVAGEVDPKKIEQFRAEGARDIANLESRAEKLNGAFGRIFNQVAKFKADGFDQAAKSLQKFAGEVYKLDKLGVSIENIDRAVTTKLAESLASKGLDAKVETSIRSIQRLRNALEFSPVDDIVGAKAALDSLESNLKNRAGQFAGLTQNNLNSELSKGLFDVRGMQRFNETAANTVTKMQNISNGFEDLSKVSIYEGWITQFENGAKRIASSSDSTGQKLQKLKILSDNVLVDAKLDSEGGFFGSIARSAGLATKRLAAFLILAQGLYSIQGVLSASLTEAVKVDKEFTKLEQVLNKDFGGTKLEQNLSTLENQIKSLGKTLGVSTLEVANAAQILAQAGIYGKDLATLLDVITKSQLGPSFGTASDTAEAAIAVFRQFNLTAEGTAAALGGINQLSAKYAVEAKGITEAVRRAGGVFSSSGDDIGSFSAAFTLIKQKTREADEAIATGLRNIAQRLQTTSIQTKVKELLNVDLVENGEFVGFENAISRIGEKLETVSSKSAKFSQVREAIAGARQGGRVTPLITDYKQFKELTTEFRKGAKSIEEDVSVAFESIENKIARATSAVTDLFHEIISSEAFKFILEGFTQVVLAVTTMLKALNSVPGAIFAIGVAAKIFSKSKGPAQAFLSHFTRRPANPLPFNNGGPSGLIPGGGPNKDSILAYLTTGEYVLNRKSTKKYGTAFLDKLNDGAFPVNSGGVIPGYNAGSPGGVGGNGVSSLFDKFFVFIKKVIGLGDVIEKTTQEIQTGLNLPELFDRAIKARAESIDIDVKSILKDKAKTNIGIIKKSGPFVDKSGDKFLPKPGTPELPSSIMDDIIASALKAPVSKKTPELSYKGNSKQLRDLSKEAGIDIPETLFKQLFKGVNVVSKDELKKGAAASFNKRTKQATFTGQSIFNPKIVAHEIGHGLETVIKGKLNSVVNALKNSGTGERTRARLIKSGIYGKENSAEFKKKFNSEIIGDIFKEVTDIKSGTGAKIPEKDRNLLNLFSNILNKQTGISITGRSKNNDAAIELSGVLDNLKQTDTERALGSGVRLPSSFNKPLNKASQSIIDKRNNEEIRNSSSSANFQSIIEAIREQGAFKGTNKGFSSNSTNRPNSPNSLISKSIPTGALATFGKSLVSSKQGLIGLGISAYSILAAFGGFESGLTKLVSAMAASAASMYALANLGNTVGFAKGALGTGIENIQKAQSREKAVSLGKTFKEKALEKKASLPKFNGPIVRTSGLSLEGIASSNRNKAKIADLASGVRGEGSNIFKSIRAAAPAKGSFEKVGKSASALANMASVKELTGVGKYMSKFTSGAKALSGKFTYGAIAVGLLTGAMDFFVGSLAEGAEAAKEKATTAKEYAAASAKGRLAESLSGAVKGIGGTASGAVTGAAIGSVIPVVGTTIGAVVGGAIGFAVSYKDTFLGILEDITPEAISGPLLEIGTVFSEWSDSVLKNISDTLYVGIENIKHGSLSEKISGLLDIGKYLSPVALGIDYLGGAKTSKGSYGEKSLKIAEQKDILDFNVQKIGKDFTDPGFGRPQERLNSTQALALQTKGKFASELLAKGKAQTSRPNAKFSDLNENTQETIKGELQDIANVYKSASPENRKLIIETYKQQGINIKELGAEVGIVIDEAADDMAIAFDELSVFFTKMKNVAELSSARISGLEGVLQNFSDPSKVSSDLPDQFFDILKQGIDPNTLGFGDIFKAGQERSAQLGKDFDPRLAANADFEITGRRAARNASSAIINSGVTLKNTTDDKIKGFVSNAFSSASGDNEQLNLAFNKFLEAQGSEGIQKLKTGGGEINGKEINDLFKEFADSLDTGALEQMQRLNSLSKQYVDQYKSHIAARFALENEAIDLLKNNVDKRRSIDDVVNKARGLTGDKLAAARGKQATTADKDRLALSLSGTGLGGSATVAEMKAALLASQSRATNAAELAKRGGGTQIEIDGRRAQIESGEEEQQNRLRASLQLVASGTDTATHNMEEFERALEKAANSSKFMTDALLGSDEQMHNTVLGLQAFAQVQEAFKTGGIDAARQVVANLGEDARQALNATVGQNSDSQAVFNQAVGISSDISGSKEAQNVIKDTATQIEANNALIAGINDNTNKMTENTANMQKIFESQFKNTQQIITQAEATSKALVDQISNLPDVIKHEGNITVKIEGAATLVELEKGMQKFVSDLIMKHMTENNNKLVANNAGLNKP